MYIYSHLHHMKTKKRNCYRISTALRCAQLNRSDKRGSDDFKIIEVDNLSIASRKNCRLISAGNKLFIVYCGDRTHVAEVFVLFKNITLTSFSCFSKFYLNLLRKKHITTWNYLTEQIYSIIFEVTINSHLDYINI